MKAVVACAVLLALAALASAQRRQPARQPAPSTPQPPPATSVAAEVTCPSPLGTGVSTRRSFCDVLTGRDPAGGIIITLPPHAGPVTLTFDLHNRQTYSEEQVKARTAYARYTATVGVLTADNTLIARAVVQSEFRKASDLVDRVGGGAGPAGVKAVAPTGTESIVVSIPEAEQQVSILGEKLVVEYTDGTATYTSAGRPIAIVSNAMIEYRPPPPPKPVRKARKAR